MTSMMKRLFNLGMIVVILAMTTSLAFAQEAEATTEPSIGFGPMIAMLGAGALAVIIVGLAMGANDSSDD